jgi:hypothetical protein
MDYVEYGPSVIIVDNTITTDNLQVVSLSIYRLVIMGFSYKLENYENNLKHYVFSSRYKIKNYAQSMN